MFNLCMNASATDVELGESLFVIWSVLISTQWINFQPWPGSATLLLLLLDQATCVVNTHTIVIICIEIFQS